MDFQRKKDRRVYESSKIAQENAWLVVLKQGEIIGCLLKLSSVLSQGLQVSFIGENAKMLEVAPDKKTIATQEHPPNDAPNKAGLGAAL
jgi:hypothetical protein